MPDPRTLELQWPAMLWLLLALPVLVAFYLRLLARRRRLAAQYASLETVDAASAGASRVRRVLPPVLLLAGLTAMIFATARPQAVALIPSRMETVILAIDVSGSMRATDLKPDRITAAQHAAKAFISAQPAHVRVGIVAAAGAAALAQSPTRNREDLVQAVDRLQLQRGTALGSGLVIALTTLLPAGTIDPEEIMNGRPSRASPADGTGQRMEAARKPAQPDAQAATAIVLLTDGENNTGPDPVKVAELAAEHGVRIYTVGMGTPEGVVLSANGWSMRVRLNEDALTRIATLTRGEYFRAASAADLTKVYASLGTRLAIEKQRATEVTALFAALGVTLTFVSALLSMLWFNRIL